MTDTEKQALAIYETIVATSGQRPTAFNSVEQLWRETAEWKKNNPALEELGRAEPDVLLAFLGQSFDWLRAEGHLAKNYKACTTLTEGIQIVLSRAPKPLGEELVSRLLGEYCREMGSMAGMFFPIRNLISSLARDQVTNEIRSKLRKLHLHLAPSPSGKIEPGTQKFRNEIAELIRVEGEIQLDQGRGPWSQIVFDEIEDEGRARARRLGRLARTLLQSGAGSSWIEMEEEGGRVDHRSGRGGSFPRCCAGWR